MQEYLYGLATDKEKGFIAALLKILLFAISFIYGLLVRTLIFIYGARPHRLKCKVISVGNITLGGTGKTALVELIARYLQQEAYKVAILSRGYKRKVHSPQSTVHNFSVDCRLSTVDYITMGDEPCMLKNNLQNIPVLVDTNRIRAAKRGIGDYGLDTVILDDGLQQWKLKKDLEIVTIDASCPFGNRRLIPRGILRQPLSTLNKANVFILTKTDLNADIKGIKDELKRINPSAEIFESMHKPLGFYKLGESRSVFDKDIFKGKTVAVFSGIACPLYFEHTLKNLGVNIGLTFRFPDHHPYSQKDLSDIAQESAGKNIAAVVTTEKDAVRITPGALTPLAAPVFVLRVRLAIIKDEERFYYRLRKLYSL